MTSQFLLGTAVARVLSVDESEVAGWRQRLVVTPEVLRSHMRASYHALLLLLIAFGMMCFAPSAHAQTAADPHTEPSSEVPQTGAEAPEAVPSEDRASSPQPVTAEPEATLVSPPGVEQRGGELRMLVFAGATPLTGVTVEIGNQSRVTNEEGSAVFSLPAATYVPHVLIPRALLPGAARTDGPVITSTVPMIVIEGEQIEAIITVDSSGKIQKADIETPGAGRAAETRRAENFEERRRSGPQGIVRGIVFLGEQGEKRQPIADARVFVRGAPVEAVTDAEGTFKLELPEGTYDIVIIHSQYTTKNLEDVKVDANKPQDVRVRVEKATPQLEAFVVTAPHIEGGVASLVAERRESSSVDDVIGAAEMSRSGDADAAGALKRVTGITVVGGQFVYVRGMGERYSATLLNQHSVPSPEPERRVIPLDLFSTDVLESVVIQKTPSADVPGEFGGGLVLLRTKTFPEELTAAVSVSTGLVTNATFRERPSYEGGSLDFLGTDDGTRELPQKIRESSPIRAGNPVIPGYSPEERAQLGRLLSNNYNLRYKRVAPNLGLDAVIGDKLQLAGIPIGFLIAGSYDNVHQYREDVFRTYIPSTTSEGGLEVADDVVISDATNSISSSVIAVAGAEPAEGQLLKATTLLLRVSDDQAAASTGRNEDQGALIRRARLRFVERQVFSQQISGSHTLPQLTDATLDWRYAYSRAMRAEPDRREYLYVDESGGASPPDFRLSGITGENQRVWNDLSDQVHDAGVDYLQPFTVWGDLAASAKFGGVITTRERQFDTLRLNFFAPRGFPAELNRQTLEEIWSPEHINADGGWILADATQATDAYTAEQQIQAGYAMATLPIATAVEVTAGARVERSRQRVSTFDPFANDDAAQQAELNNTDLLPSATAKWQISDELVLRGGYGRTLTRPDFRELSESEYRDVVTNRRYKGNPELQRGTIDNIDARLEYYFSTDELASISAFYKAFRDPIEQIDTATTDRTISWQNVDSARNLGVELELRRRFGFVADSLDEVFAAVNVALIQSQVSIGEDNVSTSKSRPLQGQSPYVINLQGGYDDEGDSGLTATFLYNVYGRRIRDVGRYQTPDVYEQPYHQLDFVLSQKFGDGWRVKFKAKNLLDQEVQFLQSTRVQRSYRSGRAFTISLGWSY